MAVGSFSGDPQVMLQHNLKSPNTLTTILRNVFYTSAFLFISLTLVGVFFCFVKIVLKVWSTSIKISKLLRSEERQQVFIFRQKIYVYLAVIALSTSLVILDLLFLRVFIYSILVITFQLCLSFLEFVRQGIEKLNVDETQSGNSEAIPLSDVSGMEIDPLTASEIDGK